MNIKPLSIISFLATAFIADAQQRVVVQPVGITASLPQKQDANLALVNSINGRGLYPKNTVPTVISRDIDGDSVNTVLNLVHKTNYSGKTDGQTEIGDLTEDLAGTFTFDLGMEKRLDGVIYWKSSTKSTITQFRIYINNDPDPTKINRIDDVVLPASTTSTNPEVFRPNLADEPAGSLNFPARLVDFTTSSRKKGRYVHIVNYLRDSSGFFLAEIAFTNTYTSNNADLDLLALEGLPLSPGFDKAAVSYQSFADFEATQVILEARPDDHEGVVAVRRRGDVSNLPSVNNEKRRWVVPLHVSAPTIIDITNKARNGTTQKTYTVTIKREAGLSDSPRAWFNGGMTKLTGEVLGDGDSTLIARGFFLSPTVQNAYPERDGTGVTEYPLVPSEAPAVEPFEENVVLDPAFNSYSYRAFADFSFDGGQTIQTLTSPVFTFTVGRNTNLAGLNVNGADISFNPEQQSYSLHVPNEGTLDFAPLLQDPGSAITNIRVPLGGEGDFIITVTAQDGTFQDYTVSLVGEAEPPATTTTYADWLAVQGFEPGELTDELVTGPHASPMNDGVTNLLRYALGLRALDPVPAGALPVTATTPDGKLQMTYRRNKNNPEDVELQVEVASTLNNFETLTAAFETVVDTTTNDDYDLVSVVTTEPITDPEYPTRFLRLKVRLIEGMNGVE